ncbi:hypothetical protein GGTG_13908 [Gaeumannomyces tritici R3-111a-1]|uniref:Uncharacterized protein n=1 Tax=Gaeumannomyces tritici (strain R3-111a-1) TaxID=644352 RepID=J3PK61_GAET3|nr:hypothetical protein GGTG_13908 [Gaeumannomyces tritici R3-111a-1]EJT68510.1 hypothetical protein GGTG_13908 [Gaeumannomyces tritici R3-111a-1]
MARSSARKKARVDFDRAIVFVLKQPFGPLLPRRPRNGRTVCFAKKEARFASGRHKGQAECQTKPGTKDASPDAEGSAPSTATPTSTAGSELDSSAASTSGGVAPTTSESAGAAGSAGTDPAAQPGAAPATAPGPVGEDEEDPLTATWRVVSTKISRGLRMVVEKDENLMFKLFLSKKPGERPKPGRVARFTLEPDSSFSLTLEGQTPGPGTYVMQVRETWESPNIYETMPATKWAICFTAWLLPRAKAPSSSL